MKFVNASLLISTSYAATHTALNLFDPQKQTTKDLIWQKAQCYSKNPIGSPQNWCDYDFNTIL